MHSASREGLRIAGLMLMAVLVAHCGDSDVRITTGGVSPARLAQSGPDWTDGCIAVTNPEMQEVFALVRDGTPVEIRP